MATYYGQKRNPYILAGQIGKGGEGAVYEIQGNSGWVAKVYSDNKFVATIDCPSPRQYMKEKITTMLDQPVNPYINGVLSVAWPQDILYDQQGKFVGYVMPRVNSKYHIFAASRERERRVLYPHYTWKTAVTIAFNLAIAVKTVHKTGAVIGDFNQNNIMLNEKGQATLIDTDSFNITNKRTGKIYKCTVGVPEMLPPELQGKDLGKASSVFTDKTDDFALAIHIFTLIVNNCHPFGCVGINKSHSSSSNNPIIKNIVKGYCPYATGGSGTPSPNAPDMMMFPAYIRQLFDRAFCYSSSTAVVNATVSNRPAAEEWQNALYTLAQEKMTKCARDASHVYPSHYVSCPWCAVTTKTASTSNSGYHSSSAHHYNTTPPPGPNLAAGGRFAGFMNRFPIFKRFVKGKPNPAPAISGIRRESWPLRLLCIAVGFISGPVLSQFLVPLLYEASGFSLSMEAGYGIMIVLGVISGIIVSHYGQEPYQRAYNAWPWLFLSLLVPVVSATVAAAITLVIFLVILVVYIAVVIIALACVCGLCAGS